MVNSHLPQEEVLENFKRRKVRQWIVAGICLVLFVPLIFLKVKRHSLSPEWMEFINTYLTLPVAQGMVVFVVGALIFSFFNWRCPVCEKYLGKAADPKFCPHCGVRFQAD